MIRTNCLRPLRKGACKRAAEPKELVPIRVGHAVVTGVNLWKRHTATLLPSLVTAMILGAACDAADRPIAKLAPASDPASSSKVQATSNAVEDKMKITIGSKTFEATLEDNPTVTKLKALLPLRLNMTELNGNEKYYDLSTRLPTDARRPGTIQAGDLMLYGDNTLVLFYKTFKTSYTYTRLGRINTPSGLAAAVGAGNVTVTFERE